LAVQIPYGKGQFLGEEAPIVKYRDTAVTCAKAAELLDGPKETQVQSYSSGIANVPTWEGRLAPPGEYD